MSNDFNEKYQSKSSALPDNAVLKKLTKESDVGVWLKKFELLMLRSQIPDTEWTSTMLLLLDDELFKTSELLGISANTPWDIAKERILKHTSTKPPQIIQYKLFNRRKQNAGESIRDYWEALRMLLPDGFNSLPNDQEESIFTLQFLDGLSSNYVKRALWALDIKDPNQALALALRYEAAEQVTTTTQPSSLSVNVASVPDPKNPAPVDKKSSNQKKQPEPLNASSYIERRRMQANPGQDS